MSGSGRSLADLLAGGPDPSVPLALWRRHQETPVGALDTLPAAARAGWPPDLLDAVLTGGGLVPRPRGRWERARTLADTTGPDLAVLVVGLNPSLYAADTGVGFGRPGNRFWPAALAAGLVTVDRDPLHALEHHRVGMTDLVKRATAKAAELDPGEYVTGVARLRTVVAWLRPGVVCVVGLTGWRAGVDRRAVAGVQTEPFGGRPVYVMPNPSGINAHVTVDDLADHLREVRRLV